MYSKLNNYFNNKILAASLFKPITNHQQGIRHEKFQPTRPFFIYFLSGVVLCDNRKITVIAIMLETDTDPDIGIPKPKNTENTENRP